jgi:hypothetical protein
MSVRGMLRPGMRAYVVPFGAGLVLVASTFLPWVVVGGVPVRGVPDVPALWTVGLGVLASVLAVLSLITRRNSRHPLLVVGLAALAVVFLSSRLMPRSAAERALAVSQAYAIVEDTPAQPAPGAVAGIGIWVGLAASCVIVLFGLTIVVKRASQPWAVADPDDDV